MESCHKKRNIFKFRRLWYTKYGLHIEDTRGPIKTEQNFIIEVHFNTYQQTFITYAYIHFVEYDMLHFSSPQSNELKKRMDDIFSLHVKISVLNSITLSDSNT